MYSDLNVIRSLFKRLRSSSSGKSTIWKISIYTDETFKHRFSYGKNEIVMADKGKCLLQIPYETNDYRLLVLKETAFSLSLIDA